ncbi:hypothetical protein K9M41_02710 [Candidatus Gracilibacteria bacterium]|nr:hypothetical protein [Candidatus Gracilibacteria bacterium]
MRKLFIFGLICTGIFLFNGKLIWAAEPIRANDSIPIIEGQILSTGLLADSTGKVFIEFPKGTQVVKKDTRESFAGTLFPPEIIARPWKNPRPRMKELFSFELIGDTADKLIFTDRFNLMSELSRLREKFQNPDSFQRTIVVRVLIPIREEVGRLGLWEFRGEELGWTRKGGMLEESTDPEVMVFTAAISGTGTFTLFDEDPPQDFIPPFPLDLVEFVGEENPATAGLEESLVDPVNEVENPEQNDIFPENEIEIPAIEEEVGINVPVEAPLVPGIEEKEAQEIFPEEIGFNSVGPTLEDLHASSLEPFLSTPMLPVAGEEGEEKSFDNFPFMIVFALLILSGSLFLAFSNHRKV